MKSLRIRGILNEAAGAGVGRRLREAVVVPRERKPCPIHEAPLKTVGARVIIDGLAPLAGQSVASYFSSAPRSFPLANAVRVRACTGDVKGRPTTTYCPECREALRDWCRACVAAEG